jgi:hypothetical protein
LHDAVKAKHRTRAGSIGMSKKTIENAIYILAILTCQLPVGMQTYGQVSHLDFPFPITSL